MSQSPVLTLAADKLAKDAKQLLDQLAARGWKPAEDLRTSFERYAELRGVDLFTTTSDSEEPVPPTQKDGGQQ